MTTENFKIVERKRNVVSLFFALLFSISFLIFILFQKALVKKLGFPKPLLYVDEVFVVIFFYLLSLYFLVIAKIDKLIFPFLKVLVIFAGVGLISGLINGNSMLVTSLGIFDYLKNFIFIFVGYYFFNSRKLLMTLYNILLFVSLILVGVAIFQELLFLLGKTATGIIRFGLLRTPSLVGHPNMFGLYIFLFFTLRLFVKRKIDFINFLLLLGIFLSLSRFVWVSTIIVLIIYSWQNKKIKNFLIILSLLVVFFIFALPYFFRHSSQELFSESFYRGYALLKSLEVWKDHKVLGAGPGMWGGVVSIIFKSPLYERYNFSDHWFKTYLQRIHSLDQFYPQLLAETGVIGFIIFIIFLYLLYKIPKQISFKVKDSFLRNFLKALSLVSIGLTLYLFGSGLNLSHFLITYSIFLGMSLGVAKNENIFNQQISLSKRWRCN